MMPVTSFDSIITHCGRICPTKDLLLSLLKYGTSYYRWYNWYIVYTTILDYNNHILFRVCQVLIRGKPEIPDQTVPVVHISKEGKEEQCGLRYVTPTS